MKGYYQLSSYTKIFRCITYFLDLIKEHLIAHIDVNDSYLKKLLRDYASYPIQNVRRTNTLKSCRTYFSKWERLTERFEEVKPLPAEDMYVGVYLLDLIKQSEAFNFINMSWLAAKYRKSCTTTFAILFLFEHL